MTGMYVVSILPREQELTPIAHRPAKGGRNHAIRSQVRIPHPWPTVLIVEAAFSNRRGSAVHVVLPSLQELKCRSRSIEVLPHLFLSRCHLPLRAVVLRHYVPKADAFFRALC